MLFVNHGHFSISVFILVFFYYCKNKQKKKQVRSCVYLLSYRIINWLHIYSSEEAEAQFKSDPLIKITRYFSVQEPTPTVLQMLHGTYITKIQPLVYAKYCTLWASQKTIQTESTQQLLTFFHLTEVPEAD